MSSASSERALRRLVAELAEAAPEDVEAVLEGLQPDQRAQVRSLLMSYSGEPPADQPAPARRKVETEDLRLSPWLRARLRASDAGEGFAMTTAAGQALRHAASLLPEERRTAAASYAARLSDVMSRAHEIVGALISRRRVAS
jgi:hypothetical protein